MILANPFLFSAIIVNMRDFSYFITYFTITVESSQLCTTEADTF